MPIYDYICGACGTTTEVVHGIHDDGPRFCPACGVKGRMKKAIVPTTILFKGSGWAKKDRSSTSTTGRSSRASSAETAEKAEKADKADKTQKQDTESSSGTSTSSSADAASPPKTADE